MSVQEASAKRDFIDFQKQADDIPDQFKAEKIMSLQVEIKGNR